MMGVATKYDGFETESTRRLAGLREALRAANGDWHEITNLWSICADLDWLLARANAGPRPSPDTDRANVMDEEWRMPCAVKVEGSIGACLVVGTDYRVAEIRGHIEPSGVEGELGHETIVIRFDPVPSPDTDAGLDVKRLARAIEQHRTGKWYDPVLKTDFEEAEGIAAEYARLATPDKEQPETSDG